MPVPYLGLCCGSIPESQELQTRRLLGPKGHIESGGQEGQLSLETGTSF